MKFKVNSYVNICIFYENNGDTQERVYPRCVCVCGGGGGGVIYYIWHSADVRAE